MDTLGIRVCAICGGALTNNEQAFAVTQSLGEDKLRVFHWTSLSNNESVYGACSVPHVRELVIHWMVTEHLDFPFAKSESGGAQTDKKPFSTHRESLPSSTPVGELAVDHDSVRRILQVDPHRLGVILNELDDALHKSIEDKSECAACVDCQEELIHHT